MIFYMPHQISKIYPPLRSVDAPKRRYILEPYPSGASISVARSATKKKLKKGIMARLSLPSTHIEPCVADIVGH